MKYKIAGMAACLCVIILSFAIPFLLREDDKRYHQHRDAAVKTSTEADADTFSTHLPLVIIDTGGVTIPGKPVYNEEGVATRTYTTAEDGSTRIPGHIDIIDNPTTYNHPDDTPAISSSMEIRVRGRSSREFDKSSYYIKLVNDDGTNNQQPVMGMDAHHEWILYGPYLDKSLMRNYMWYNIAGEIMDYAANVRFCEAIVNGEYQGLYVMMESLTAGQDGARMNLTVNQKNETFSGYLLRLDDQISEPIKMTNNFSVYTRRTQLALEIIYPGEQNLTREIADAIAQDFSDFEKALYSYDYDNKTYGYPAYIDIESFVDYFLINEVTCNYDAGWLSTYIYKSVDGKFRMCIWDFNSACDYYTDTVTDPMRFQMHTGLWYVMLMKDEDFVQRIIDRYRELRKTWFSEEYLFRYIDETAAFLGSAVDRNYSVWGYTFGQQYDMLVPAERNVRSFEEALQQMKDFLSARLDWMDENIESLHQYSAESKVKKFNENAN